MSRLSSTTLQIGDPAPPFALFAINEQLVHLSEVLDEVHLLLLFAPGGWSPDTRRQIAEMSACYDRLQEAGVGVLAIVTEDARSLRRRLATQMPPFPILSDENREAARSFGVFRALSWDGVGITRPATFLIDRSGAVRFIYVGERASDLPETDALVRLVGDILHIQVPEVVVEEAEEALIVVAAVAEPDAEALLDDVMALLAVPDDTLPTEGLEFAVAEETAEAGLDGVDAALAATRPSNVDAVADEVGAVVAQAAIPGLLDDDGRHSADDGNHTEVVEEASAPSGEEDAKSVEAATPAGAPSSGATG